MKNEAVQIVLGITIAQWIVFVIGSFASRAKTPRTGLRSAERNLIVSSVLLVAVWLYTFGMPLMPATAAHSADPSATAAKAATGSCASIDVGMNAAQVKERLGKADETRNDEATRGPGAAILIYRDSRCSIHLLDDKVELVD